MPAEGEWVETKSITFQGVTGHFYKWNQPIPEVPVSHAIRIKIYRTMKNICIDAEFERGKDIFYSFPVHRANVYLFKAGVCDPSLSMKFNSTFEVEFHGDVSVTRLDTECKDKDSITIFVENI